MQNRLHRATVAMTGNLENRRESEFSYSGIRPAKYQAEFNRDLSWTDPLFEPVANRFPLAMRSSYCHQIARAKLADLHSQCLP
jgi:hypothetical protein